MNFGLTGAQPLPPPSRKAMIAGCVGFAVDFFDIYLPVLALAPVTRYFQPPGLSSTATTTIFFSSSPRPCWAARAARWSSAIGPTGSGAGG